MPIKYVIIKEIKSGTTKNGSTYPWILDQEGIRWNLFPPLPQVTINKAYAFHFEQNGEFCNVKKIEPIINIFKAEVLKELASKNELQKQISICLSYATSLSANGIIEPDKILEWSDKFYDYSTQKCDSEYEKINNPAIPSPKDVK